MYHWALAFAVVIGLPIIGTHYFQTQNPLFLYLQGPISRILIEEISLGRTKGARKLYDGLARAAASARWQIPFTIRGVAIVLQDKTPQAKLTGHKPKAWDIHKLLTGLVAQILLCMLPFVPIRIKDISVIHKVKLQMTPYACVSGHQSLSQEKMSRTS